MDSNDIVTRVTTTGNMPDEQRAEIDRLKTGLSRRLQPPLDLATLPDRELPPLDFTLGSLGLLKHVCGVLSADGGTGKGFFLLGLAASVACEAADIPFFGIDRLPAPARRGKVVLLFAEDPKHVLEARIQALLLVTRARYGNDAMRSVAANLRVESLHGQAPCLVTKGGDADTVLCRAWQEIVAERVDGARLFALDTASCFHRANENDNGEMTVFMQVCNRLATETKGSGLLLHHVPKGSPEQSRGASAITNSARWACNLVRSRNDKAMVEVRQWKENYIALMDEFTLVRGAGGVLGAPQMTTKRINGRSFQIAD